MTSLSVSFARPEEPARLRLAVLGLGRYSGGSPIGFHLARALASHHDVHVFVDAGALNLAQWETSSVPMTTVRTYSSLSGAIATLIVPCRLLALRRAIRRFSPDAVLVPFIHLWVLPLVWSLRLPFVTFVHDPEPHPGLVGRLWHFIERRVVRASRHVLIHSSHFRPLLLTRYGVEPPRVSVVPIGPLTDYTNAGQELRSGPPPVAPTVLCFGRMESYKGIDVLLDAVPTIRARRPDALVRFVGRGLDGPTLARAAILGGVEVVNRWVSDDELPEFFLSASVVVLPYTSATQSGVIPIAAAFAVPVVATTVGGLPEQLADGACGVLVAPGDSQALAAAVVALLDDPERARQLGESLRREYLEHRSWEQVAEVVARACKQGAGEPPYRRNPA